MRKESFYGILNPYRAYFQNATKSYKMVWIKAMEEFKRGFREFFNIGDSQLLA